ncbi:MAG: hypothetical protein KDH96_13380, partial [Candidatus Riesia sp.]|nr:hypothetical protein [Candidatus Riesia sp.]
KTDHTIDFMIYCNAKTNQMILLSIIQKSYLKTFGLEKISREIYDSFGVNYDMFSIVLVPFMTTFMKKDIAPSHILNEKYNKSYHGKIMECSFDFTNGWKMIRERFDKTAPNHFKVAIMSFMNNINNISIDALINPGKHITMFFKYKSAENYQNMRYFHSLIRQNLINKYIMQGDDVLDLGSGRGNTFFHMARLKPRSITMMDVDDIAITEFYERIFDTGNKNRNTGLETELNIISGSFIDPDDTDLINPNKPYNVIFCSFAIHFAFESETAFTIFMKLVDRVSSKTNNTIVIILAIDGDKLFDKLKKNTKYNIPADGSLKYTFESAYG